MPYVILVTGANKGIGYEAVKLLSQEKAGSDTVILLGTRSTKNGQEAIEKMKSSVAEHPFDNIKVLEIDVTDSASLEAAVQHVKSTYKQLDVLIHNSGISNIDGDYKSPAIFDVNIIGAKDCIEGFTPILTPSTGIVTLVSSTVGPWYMDTLEDEATKKMLDVDNASWSDIEGWMKDWDTFGSGGESKHKWIPESNGMIASKYCVSKAILNPWFRQYAASHPDVKAAAVCPGYCATELNNFQGPRPASVGGKSVIWPALNEFTTGKFYLDGKQVPYAGPLPQWVNDQMAGKE
jgi:NAD(P)-dependent dehydrogenase (short-subunit alcohol dehydrogenase family)